MKKKIFFVILIILAMAIFLFFYLGEKRDGLLSSELENIPDTPINKICLEIAHSDNIYYCLAVANQDEDYCQDLSMPSEKKLCQAMAARDISYCRKIQEAEPKKVCYYELSFLVGEFDYCAEVDNPNMCYFSIVYRLHWESRANEINTKLCGQFDENTSDGQIFKNCCLAFKNYDSSLCQGNKYCLSFFKQPMSFCDTKLELPGGGLANENECLLHRALSEKDSSICAKIKSKEGRDMCYADMSTHVSPNLSFCDKIVNDMIKDMCYAEFAINFAQQK